MDMHDRIRDATEFLEQIGRDRSLLEGLSDEDRIRFLNAAGGAFNPDTEERRQWARARKRQQRRDKIQRDEGVLAETGIRRLRAKPVYTTPNVFAPEGFEPHDLSEAATRGRRRQALLRVQEALPADAPLLRPALPIVRASTTSPNAPRRPICPGVSRC